MDSNIRKRTAAEAREEYRKAIAPMRQERFDHFPTAQAKQQRQQELAATEKAVQRGELPF